MEDNGILNICDDHDLYALHVTFLLLIQRQLDQFKSGWANHSLRTEQNRTPKQLWLMGLHEMHIQDPDHEAIEGIISEVRYHNYYIIVIIMTISSINVYLLYATMHQRAIYYASSGSRFHPPHTQW